MAGYFSAFQKILYSMDDNNLAPVAVTNILQRSSFLREITENVSYSYEYSIKDGETAEIIADKLYGSADRHWIVLLFNKIVNPFYEFPLDSEMLADHILEKYDMDVNTAQSTIHHWEMITTKNNYSGLTQLGETETSTYISEYMVDYDSGEITPISLPSDPDVTIPHDSESVLLPDGSTLDITREIKSVSIYTYELLENENRRKIRLLDKSYVFRVEEEFRKLMLQ